jgi:hypothetical protein
LHCEDTGQSLERAFLDTEEVGGSNPPAPTRSAGQAASNDRHLASSSAAVVRVWIVVVSSAWRLVSNGEDRLFR